MSLRRNFAWLLSNRVITIGVSFLAAALINRSLGPDDRGVYAEIQTWILFFMTAFGVSIDSVIYHFANREQYPVSDASKLSTMLVNCLGYAGGGALVLYVLTLLRPDLFSPAARANVPGLSLWFTGMLLVNALLYFMQAIGRVREAAIVGVLYNGAMGAFIATAYLYDWITVARLIYIMSAVQGVAVLLLLLQFRVLDLLGGPFSRELSKAIMKAGLKHHTATMSTFIYTRVNQIILYQYAGETASGLFAVALTLSMQMTVIPMALQSALFPRVIHATDDYEVTVRTLRLTVYGWGACAGLAALLARPLILLYAGDEYLQAVPLFRIMLFCTWAIPLSSMIAPYYIKKGAFMYSSVIAAILGVFSVGLNFVLIQKYQALGAALTTALTCMTSFMLMVTLLGYLSKRNPLEIFKPDFSDVLRKPAE